MGVEGEEGSVGLLVGVWRTMLYIGFRGMENICNIKGEGLGRRSFVRWCYC